MEFTSYGSLMKTFAQGSVAKQIGISLVRSMTPTRKPCCSSDILGAPQDSVAAGHKPFFQNCPIKLLCKDELNEVELSSEEKKFIEIASGHEQMQDCHEELKPLLKYSTTTFTFDDSKLVGYIKKYTQQSKLVGRNSHLRCIIIDLKAAMVIIKHDKDTTDTSKIKKIMFRDITGVYFRDSKQSEYEEFKYKFNVQTTEREYVFSARTTYERKIWIAGFRFLIVMTAIMQSIFRADMNTIDNHGQKRSASEVPDFRNLRFTDPREP